MADSKGHNGVNNSLSPQFLLYLVEVGIYLAAGSYCCGAYQCVGSCRVLVEILGSLLPLLGVSITQTGIEVGEIGCIGAAVVRSNLHETYTVGTVTIKSLVKYC